MPKPLPPPALALILALATGVAPLAASAGPGSPAPAASAPLAGIVVDAQGTPMGPYYPGAVDGAVLLSLAGRPMLLPLRGGAANAGPDRMEPAPNSGEVFFETTNCTGQGWLQTSRLAGLAAVTVQPTGPHNVVVYMPDTAPPSNVTVGSALVVRSTRQPPVCQVGPALGRMRKALQVIDISTLYVAPYHLQ